MDGIRRHIIIKSNTIEEMCEVRDKIHYQLVCNIDYINCNIVLNDDGCDVHLMFFSECEVIPVITL